MKDIATNDFFLLTVAIVTLPSHSNCTQYLTQLNGIKTDTMDNQVICVRTKTGKIPRRSLLSKIKIIKGNKYTWDEQNYFVVILEIN